jgi:formylmethanofuran dehydrogenase subunit E-like metal-binding protein
MADLFGMVSIAWNWIAGMSYRKILMNQHNHFYIYVIAGMMVFFMIIGMIVFLFFLMISKMRGV